MIIQLCASFFYANLMTRPNNKSNLVSWPSDHLHSIKLKFRLIHNREPFNLHQYRANSLKIFVYQLCTNCDKNLTAPVVQWTKFGPSESDRLPLHEIEVWHMTFLEKRRHRRKMIVKCREACGAATVGSHILIFVELEKRSVPVPIQLFF